MRIESVETILASLPLPGPAWGDTIHHVTHIEILLADVRTDTGLVGTGFSYTSGGGTTLRALLDKDLAPLVVGQEVSPRGLWHKCWHHVHDMGAAASRRQPSRRSTSPFGTWSRRRWESRWSPCWDHIESACSPMPAAST